MPFSWSSKGDLLFQALSPDGDHDLWSSRISRDGQLLGEPEAFVQTEAQEYIPVMSPNERHVAYVSAEGAGLEVYVTSFPKPDQRVKVSAAGGSFPLWRSDGRELFFIDGESYLNAASVTYPSEDEIVIESAERLFPVWSGYGPYTGGQMPHVYAVAPDGERFLLVVPLEGTSDSAITLVLNP